MSFLFIIIVTIVVFYSLLKRTIILPLTPSNEVWSSNHAVNDLILAHQFVA